MQAPPPVHQPSIGVATLLSVPLALVLASGFASLACFGGFLFSGVDTVLVVISTVVVCAIGTPVTALIFRRRQAHFGWHRLVIAVSVLAFVAVGVLSWLMTRDHLRIFSKPSPIPRGLRVRHGRQNLFGSYVHFTSPSSAIIALLESKGLLEVPAERSETSDDEAFREKERSKTPWDWWQPAKMSNPRFYYRSYKSEFGQGWSVGWWVNGATNEVYAYISGG